MSNEKYFIIQVAKAKKDLGVLMSDLVQLQDELNQEFDNFEKRWDEKVREII